MPDQISIDRLSLLHPKVRAESIDLYHKANEQLAGRAQVRIVQGLRTFEEQDGLYAQGRTKPGAVVTKAKGGQSYHNYGLAIDFALLIDNKEISWNTMQDYDRDGIADWKEVVNVFVAAGWYWGSAFNDLPHLEKRFGIHWSDMLKLYNAGKFIEGTKYIILP